MATVAVARVLRTAEPGDDDLAREASSIAARLGLARARVRVSRHTTVPFSAALIRPIQVLPASLLNDLCPAERRLLLAHELAHAAAGDGRRAFGAALLGVLFTGHPVWRWASRALVLAREMAVDEQVAREDEHTYGALLLKVAAVPKTRFGEAIAGAGEALKARIEALLSHPPAGRPRARTAAVAAFGLTALGGTLAAFSCGGGEPMGALPPEAIIAVIDSNKAQIRYCYEVGLVRDSTLQGVIKARWLIEPDGRVDEVSFLEGSIADQALQSCMADTLRSWRYPPPAGGGRVEVRYPFKLVPTTDATSAEPADQGLTVNTASASATRAEVPAARPLEGSLTRDEIISGVKAQAEATGPCFSAARKAGTLAAGELTLVLEWSIAADGAVTDAHVRGPETVVGTEMSACIEETIESWRFRATQRATPIKGFPFGPLHIQ